MIYYINLNDFLKVIEGNTDNDDDDDKKDQR